MEQGLEHTQMSIEDVLPEDCIFHIFSFLQLKELISIERVCKRWQRLSQRCWSSNKALELYGLKQGEYSSLHLGRSNVTHLISICGNRLSDLFAVLDADDEITTTEMLQLIGDHCVNLYHLDLNLIWDGFEIIPQSFLRLLSKLKSLTILGNIVAAHLETFLCAAKILKDFVIYDYSGGRPEFLKNLTPNCRRLEVYNIKEPSESEYDLTEVLPKLSKLGTFKSNCAAVSSLVHLPESCAYLELTCWLGDRDLNFNEVLQRLKNLRFLKLSSGDGGRFHPSALAPASQSLEELSLSNSHYFYNGAWPFLFHLRVLKFWDYNSYRNKALPLLFSRCPNLEELHMYVNNLGMNGVQQITSLRILRRLKITFCKDMDEDCVQFLCDNMCETLESFDCRTSRFSDEQLLKLLRRCDKLTHLRADLLNEEEFMNQASEIVRGRAEKTPLRLG